jgi:16S rRNA G966 N2-methylase RsmD
MHYIEQLQGLDSLIFTDPPYGKEYLSLYQELAKLSKRVLKRGGFKILVDIGS